ncbi:DNA-binding response regulator [Amycolatopsis sp. WAC 01376]|uniref:response regulator n=1 Tax=Amycolatopsis sp. WAC 01376 TaxID=2203195 RepID=UPI000F786805|nr:response regulator transcription factor [Amycolatopsis sp. WAC 01376]RSM62459.1 DNA-binding response regulator [Amycolatopsis sp. WAC 01376]
MTSAVKVLICDDQELVRVGMGMIVTSQDDLTVAGEAANGAEAVETALKLRPDLVLMDVRMPVLDGVAATERICAALPGTRVLMITTFDLDEYAYAALRAGASGFLVKDAPAEEILVAIRGVLRGDSMISPSVTKRLLDRYLDAALDGGESKRLEKLTEREKDVLALIARGLANSEIASKLYIGETTVKTHVGRILAKLSLRDRVHAVVFAYESGLVRAGG